MTSLPAAVLKSFIATCQQAKLDSWCWSAWMLVRTAVRSGGRTRQMWCALRGLGALGGVVTA